jgi:hypothetical protein
MNLNDFKPKFKPSQIWELELWFKDLNQINLNSSLEYFRKGNLGFDSKLKSMILGIQRKGDLNSASEFGFMEKILTSFWTWVGLCSRKELYMQCNLANFFECIILVNFRNLKFRVLHVSCIDRTMEKSRPNHSQWWPLLRSLRRRERLWVATEPAEHLRLLIELDYTIKVMFGLLHVRFLEPWWA